MQNHALTRSRFQIEIAARAWRRVAEFGLSGFVRLSPFIALLVLLCGCASFPKQSTGQFDARNGDFIVIKKDGALYWSPLAKTGSQLVFVGIATPDKENPNLFRLIVPSSSPFLDSSIGFSPDFSHVTVNWGKRQRADDAARNRATEYEKVITK